MTWSPRIWARAAGKDSGISPFRWSGRRCCPDRCWCFAYVFSTYEVPALLGVRYPRALPVLALQFFNNPDLRSRAEGMVISLMIAVIVLVVAVVSLRRGERPA